MEPIHLVGRVLRIVLGLALIIYVAPVYFRIPLGVTVTSLLLMLGLIGVCCLINFLVLRQTIAFSAGLGAVVTSGLLIALYFVGFSGLPIVGHGKGQLAAISFLGISLLIAGLRATPGCEVMAIPSLLFRKHAELPCLIFSPLDKLESKLQRKRETEH